MMPVQDDSPEIALLKKISRRIDGLDTRMAAIEERATIDDLDLASMRLRLARLDADVRKYTRRKAA